MMDDHIADDVGVPRQISEASGKLRGEILVTDN
jgi:hypothetical protein